MPENPPDPNKVTEADYDRDESDADLDEDSDDDRSRPIVRTEDLKHDACMALAAAAFDAATTSSVRRRLHERKEPLAIVVRVPTPAWVAPVEAYCARTFVRSWKRIARDGTDRHHRADQGSQDVARELGDGHSVVGIAADVGILPSTLVGAADLRIEIAPLTGRTLSDAFTRYAGSRRRRDFSKISLAGLDFPDIVAAFRRGSSARTIRHRLAAAAARIGGEIAAEELPDLQTATEYGEARDWALALARDVADYRAGRIPWSALDRGCVVHSEPGCGKSLWARMVAKACGIGLLESSVADWFMAGSGQLNDVIRAERQVFSQALAQAPCILLLDEIDAIPNRATMSERNRDYWTPILNDILSNLDNGLAGGGRREGIIVIGATNRIEDLDTALMRPGRLERAIRIKRPDFAGTLNILRHHVAGDVDQRDLGEIAGLMEGSTGAEIMQYVRQARRLARHRGSSLSADDLQTVALPRCRLAPDVLWRVCVHEAGHAVATLVLKCGKVKRCVIRDGDGSLGETLVEAVDADLPTKTDIEDRVVAVLSGRAAEETIFGSASSNAGGDVTSDLAIATRLVGCLHVAVGLGDSLAYIAGPNEVADLLRKDRLLRRKVTTHLAELHRRAAELIVGHREAVVAVADRLRRRRHVSGDDIQRVLEASSVERRGPDGPC